MPFKTAVMHKTLKSRVHNFKRNQQNRYRSQDYMVGKPDTLFCFNRSLAHVTNQGFDTVSNIHSHNNNWA